MCSVRVEKARIGKLLFTGRWRRPEGSTGAHAGGVETGCSRGLKTWMWTGNARQTVSSGGVGALLVNVGSWGAVQLGAREEIT